MQKSLQEILGDIQAKIKVPKGQYNSHGGYKYRKCEDIMAAFKEIRPDGVSVNLNDTIEHIGDRFYIKATATIRYKNEEISVSSYAREPESRKGMDEAQISGATSSYARKYALQGLFLIDDSPHEIESAPEIDSLPPAENAEYSDKNTNLNKGTLNMLLKHMQHEKDKHKLRQRTGEWIARHPQLRDEIIEAAKKRAFEIDDKDEA